MAKNGIPDTQPPDIAKRAKQRSPNYPVISLKKAMPKVMGLYQSYKRNWVPVGIVHQNWKYKAHSGAGNQVVAALKSYGLVDIEGNGTERKIRVSDRAFQIAQQHKDQPELLKKSAVTPAIHAELWNKYKDEGIPPDDVVRHYLVFDRGFNPDTVNSFIASFRETIEFAKLSASDTITTSDGGNSDENSDENGDDMGDQTDPDNIRQDQKNQQKHRPPDNWTGPKVVLDLPRGNQIEIRLRSKVTPKEFAQIKKVYELSELSFIDHDQNEQA